MFRASSATFPLSPLLLFWAIAVMIRNLSSVSLGTTSFKGFSLSSPLVSCSFNFLMLLRHPVCLWFPFISVLIHLVYVLSFYSQMYLSFPSFVVCFSLSQLPFVCEFDPSCNTFALYHIYQFSSVQLQQLFMAPLPSACLAFSAVLL